MSKKPTHDKMTESYDNFTADDLQKLQRIRDVGQAREFALNLISTDSKRPMKPEKIRWFGHQLQKKRSVMDIVTMMYELMLAGEGNSVVGSSRGMAKNSYRKAFGEGWTEVPAIDRERYTDIPGLEGPFQSRAGKVLY